MFLMNAPPVIALQSKWESFGQSGSFRFPVCFSESEEDISRASVSAKVQMIINNLQSEEASLGMNNEYIMQKNQRGGKYKGARIAAANTIVLKEHSTYAKSELSTEFDHMEDDSSDFGPLVLESDSDDSVDREIEQAIQEYLKEKSNTLQSLPSSNTTCFGTTDGNNRVKGDFPQNNVTTHLPPVKFKSDVVSEAVICNPKGIHDKPRASSPLSVSSDDSFEQSIQAEIEQFLNEKKQQEVHKCSVPLDKRTEQKEVLVKAVSKSNKESIVRSNRQDLKQGCKELIFKQYPELGKTNVQPKCFKPKISTESENFTNTRLAPPKLAGMCNPLETAQNKGGEKKHSSANRREQKLKSAALVYEISDSSSDDGIEEAIQMYQLEKIRKEPSSTVDSNLLQKTQPRDDRVSDFTTSIAVGSSKSALLESHKKTLNSKKKQTASKATELSNSSCDSNRLFKPLKETKVSTPPLNTIAKCEFTVQPSFQAETSAELMCAEAILDIYKTIMPSHVESNDRSLSTNPLFSSQNVPSHPDSDSSLVDSDDSIEQEIRTFLALKAQSEHLLAKPDNLSKSVQGPPLPEHSNKGSSSKVPLSKTLKLSLCCKRKLKGERKVVKQLTPKKTKGLERELETEYSQGKIHIFQEKKELTSQDKICKSESREDEVTCQFLSSNLVGLIDEHIAFDLRSSLSQAHGKVAQGRNLEQEKPGSGDKSSSLDSDEDLDTAIKDLLRSKRKLKKRCRDSKPHCKKKVKLNSTGTQFLDKFNKLQKHWKDKSPHLLQTCLPGSKRDNRENAVKKPLNTCNSRTERGKQGKKQEDLQLAFQLEKKNFSKPLVTDDMEISENRNSAISTISLSDDSSSVDSDDSIEQEIRKFLAEKAKYSLSSSEIQESGVTTALGIGRVSKPEIVNGKEKHQSVGNQPGLLSSQSQKNKIASQKAEDLKISDKTVIQSAINILNDGRKSTSCPGNIYLHSTLAVKTKHETVTPKICCGSLSVKEASVDKKGVCNKDQSQKSLHPTDTENVSRLQNYCITDITAPEKSNSFQGKWCSKSTCDQKCVPENERHLLFNNRQYTLQSDFVHKGVFQNFCVFNTDGRETVQKGSHRKERGKRLKAQTRSNTNGAVDHQQSLHLTGFHSLIPTGVFNFGKSTSQGSKQMSVLDSNQAVPLQVPLFTSLKESKLSKDSGIFGSSYLLLKKEGSDWQNVKTQAGLNMREAKKFSSEGKIIDLRNRRIVDKDVRDQKVLENDSSEFNGTSKEESRNSVVKGKILNF